jgi:hypothetical protein|nr:MAG TPA: Protein of unknown function (DUF1353) [Caudoviricetes sp.]
MVNRPILKPVGKYQFELVENYRYRDIVIPRGYITDGASVPRIFWSIFPPNKAEYLSAAIVHDYLTDIVIEKKSITFRSVDNTFKEMLIDLNVNKIEVKVLYWSVRLYHLLRYGD